MAHLPCAIIRGGTSKGVFLRDEHLPPDTAVRDRLLLALMGSPDVRQIDGLGGADPLTSKVAIIGRSERQGIDVEYESLEVGIAEAHVNHGLMCGNLIAGVGYFAIAEGLIAAQTPATVVRIHCRSNGQIVLARVPVAGTLGRNPMVGLLFHNPAGAITGQLMPLGEPQSEIVLPDGRAITVSVFDAATLYTFVRADALGLTGHESAARLDADADLRRTVEQLRERVAAAITDRHGKPLPSRLVKVALLAEPAASATDHDIVARIINPASVHKAYAVSGAICLAAAGTIAGSLAHAIAPATATPFHLRIGHPAGVLTLALHWSLERHGVLVHAAEIERSARILLRGVAYLPEVEEAMAIPPEPVVVLAGGQQEVGLALHP